MAKHKGAMVSIVAAAALAASVVLTWWLFLGRDTTYQLDAEGRAGGPYEISQVVWCVVVLALLAAAGALVLVHWVAIATTSLAFTLAWSINAGSNDQTGLWVVGAIGVLLGSVLGSGLVVFLVQQFTELLVRRRSRPTRRG